MTGLRRALLTATLLLLTAAGLYAGETNPPAADRTLSSTEQWTKYDWNGSTGKSGKANFDIEKGKDGGRLRITAAMPDDARFVRELAVEPDTVYRFSCRVRTENVGST